jgi:hypothetical protein
MKFRIALVISICLPLECAELRLPDYPVRTANECAVKAEQAGVAIGAQPLEDLGEQKIYFKTELTPKGFIPVFVVIQNGSSTDSFLFDKTKMTYGPVDATSSSPKTGSKTGQTLLLIGAAGSPIALFVGAKMLTKASQVQQHMLKSEVQSKTLPPGSSVHGFIYVPVRKADSGKKVRLQIPITKSGTDDTFVLDLVI